MMFIYWNLFKALEEGEIRHWKHAPGFYFPTYYIIIYYNNDNDDDNNNNNKQNNFLHCTGKAKNRLTIE